MDVIHKNGAMSTVDNILVQSGLIEGSKLLKNIPISSTYPPTFLLDTNRVNRFKLNETVFDNSWDIYAQDLPTANFFLKNDINKILVRISYLEIKIQKDLNKILYDYQKKGLKIYITNGYDPPKEIKIKKQLFK